MYGSFNISNFFLCDENVISPSPGPQIRKISKIDFIVKLITTSDVCYCLLSDNFKQRGKIKDKEIGGKRNGMEK